MTPQNPFNRRHHRGADHLRTCTECAARLNRERQYIERLRDAPVPQASNDLTARLLARTEVLAAAPEPATAQHPAARVLALTAGGTAAAAGILAISAFALAGDVLPVPAAAMNGSLVQHTARLPADGRELSEPQLSALRSEGWVCPGLESLGFHLQTAKAVTHNGRPAVELHLSDGQHYATIVEQHSAEPGRKVGELLVTSGAPWTATYETAAGTFLVTSDLPAEKADDAVPLLQKLSEFAAEGINARVSTEPAPAQASAPGESPTARLERGIRKIGEMLGP